MQKTSSQTMRKWLADYRPPAWQIPEASLTFKLGAAETLVETRLQVKRATIGSNEPLHLDGDGLELLSLRVNGVERQIPAAATSGLSIAIEEDNATIETVTRIHPAANTRLMGLYASGGNLCTQCEAEGFRRITYFIDRPDVLTRFKTRLEGDARRYPVLLGNGNLVEKGQLEGGRHYTVWDDPFPKPCYLFAIVAGALVPLRDTFTTSSGKKVDLAIWAAEEDIGRCRHALDSLKQAMAFDEQFYGREYDLGKFDIVAVHDFNFGAMENKSLNVFNAKYILADPELATDQDYDAISSVVGHEYFHNWSGDRVTCRDWFQLSLKEGFTVYREQQFAAYLASPAVKRIEEIRKLRALQFAEDAGPMAHPVRPKSYEEITNFYTTTIYDKGGELIRMMATHLGGDAYRRATDRYFADNDGRAATIKDFLKALGGEGLPADLFERWYDQPGTPELTAELQYDPQKQVARIRWSQKNPMAGAAALPLPIPCRFALFGQDGTLLYEENNLLLTERQSVTEIPGIKEPPLLSLNRGFAAPIITRPTPSNASLKLLAAAEKDSFARYEATQQLMLSVILATIAGDAHSQDVVDVVRSALQDWEKDPAFTAESVLLPSEAIIANQMEKADPAKILAAREALQTDLLLGLGTTLWETYRAIGSVPASDLSPIAKGKRRLQSVLLQILSANDSTEAVKTAAALYDGADGMTPRMAALESLSHSNSPERERVLSDFYSRFKAFPGALDKWFTVQASSRRPDTLAKVVELTKHPAFDRHNPNRLRALILAFANNQGRFHMGNGESYAFLREEILTADAFNAQSAARLAGPLLKWRHMATPYAEHMRENLRLLSENPMSRDLKELVSAALA